MPRKLTPGALALLTLIVALALPAESAKSEKLTLGDVPQKVEKKKKRKAAEPANPTPEEKKQLLTDVTGEFLTLGKTALREGKLSQAKIYFERVLVLEPNHREAQTLLDKVNQKLEAQNPPSARPSAKDSRMQLLGKLDQEMTRNVRDKDWRNAYGAAKKILAIDPAHANAKKQKAVIESNLFEQALKRGEAREKAGDLQSAVDAYQMAASYRQDAGVQNKISELQSQMALSNKKRSEALYIQALKSSQDGKKGEALQLCREALKIDPGNLQARRMEERLKGIR